MRCWKLHQSADVENLPQRICIFCRQLELWMMHAEQVNQVTISLEIRMRAFACMTRTCAWWARCVFCWTHNNCQTIRIPTTSCCNLHVCSWNLALCFTHMWILTTLLTSGTLQSIFTSHWPFRQNRECCKIPSATSVRLGCVKKESSLWLLRLWITPQYGITLQWMSADTIPAVQLWNIQQRFSYRAAMEYLLIWYHLM